jgi:poly-gamma-glutamate capsule biosynthesis protein CapA/YwtB (metallophosphatase superfamily)
MRPLTLFLCGDVMTGRGIDQILPHPSDPKLYEPWVKSATEYVAMAETANGPIPRQAGFEYIWGDAADEWSNLKPDARIINLETAVTASTDWYSKGINYRMHPANAGCLTAAHIDCCGLANNHVLDWGHAGLLETMSTLEAARIKFAGAGRNAAQAARPAVLEFAGVGRVLVWAVGAQDSGIPREWAASVMRPGIALLADYSERAVKRMGEQIATVKRPGDIAVLSIHWGGNWGYEVPPEHRGLAHLLIDAGVDAVHGHSSHHPKGIEVYNGKPILYGCGDFINDYEGIGGYEEYRGNLVLMYFLTVDPASGRLIRLEMTPLEIKRFQLRRAKRQDGLWLQNTLDREGRRLGTRVVWTANGRLALEW